VISSFWLLARENGLVHIREVDELEEKIRMIIHAITKSQLITFFKSSKGEWMNE
jgi:DNA replicative helicase MCM subunit Mcm2 (Cdc46/Mcm family)